VSGHAVPGGTTCINPPTACTSPPARRGTGGGPPPSPGEKAQAKVRALSGGMQCPFSLPSAVRIGDRNVLAPPTPSDALPPPGSAPGGRWRRPERRGRRLEREVRGVSRGVETSARDRSELRWIWGSRRRVTTSWGDRLKMAIGLGFLARVVAQRGGGPPPGPDHAGFVRVFTQDLATPPCPMPSEQGIIINGSSLCVGSATPKCLPSDRDGRTPASRICHPTIGTRNVYEAPCRPCQAIAPAFRDLRLGAFSVRAPATTCSRSPPFQVSPVSLGRPIHLDGLPHFQFSTVACWRNDTDICTLQNLPPSFGSV
jgi:hypothetical protein